MKPCDVLKIMFILLAVAACGLVLYLAVNFAMCGK